MSANAARSAAPYGTSNASGNGAAAKAAPSHGAPPLLLRVADVQKSHTIYHSTAFSVKEQVVSLMRASAARVETVEALRGVSFDLHARECVGIVGRNGAGKSTLLRMIAGISQPDSGSVTVNGTIASLIELGAGFHPELSGVENIFLYANLTGIPRALVRERLAELVKFSGIGRFLFMPVKHYSSGMLIRLAFSVAIHFDPKILLLDEVMAVGDADFQRKSRDRIEEMRVAGAAVVLVSHDLSLIETACDRVIWLEGGRVQADGPALDVVAAYSEHEYRRESRSAPNAALSARDSARLAFARFGSGELVVNALRMFDRDGNRRRRLQPGELLRLEMDIYRLRDDELPADRPRRQEVGPANLMVSMSRADGVAVFHVHWMGTQQLVDEQRGGGSISAEAPITSNPEAAADADSNTKPTEAITLERQPIEPPAPGETVTVTLEIDSMNYAPGAYRLSWALYPAAVGGFPSLDDDYPYDCHLRTVEFGIATAPGEAWGEAGGARLDFEATVETLPVK